MNGEMSTTKEKEVIWEENDSTPPPKKSALPSTNDVCDITIVTNDSNGNVPSTATTKISGIYKIINKVNGKYYVGCSSDIYRRIASHIYKLKRNINSCRYLQNAYNKYGVNNFSWTIIELCPDTNLLEVEQKYLNISKSEKNKSYNISFVAGRIEWNNENKEIRRNKYKGDGNPNYGNGNKIRGINNPFYGKHHTTFSKEKSYLTKKDNNILNQRIFTFKHRITKTTFTGIQCDFYKLYDLDRGNVMKLTQKIIKSVKSWMLI